MHAKCRAVIFLAIVLSSCSSHSGSLPATVKKGSPRHVMSGGGITIADKYVNASPGRAIPVGDPFTRTQRG